MTRLGQDWDIFAHHDLNHVLPRFDTTPHDPVPQCWCHPHRQNDLYIHHASDGRDPFKVEAAFEDTEVTHEEIYKALPNIPYTGSEVVFLLGRAGLCIKRVKKEPK